MSERAIIRAAARRARRRARRVGVGATFAVTAAAASAPAASAIEVNSLGDPGNGTCDVAQCTLREAIDLAGSNAGPDTITFKSGLSGTIALNSTAGQLSLSSPVSIVGPGAQQVTISGDSDLNGIPDTRIMYVDAQDASISGLTITKGAGKVNGSASAFSGGAIYMRGAELTLDHVVVSDSVAGSGNWGGGIYSKRSDLVVTNSVIKGNTAASGSYARGGGIATSTYAGVHSSTLTVTNTTIAGNKAGENGGGLHITGISSAVIDHSTLSGNRAGSGGAARISDNGSGGTVLITDSTISGNTASSTGGLDLNGTPAGVTIQNSTIAGNTGEGIFRAPSSGPVTISSSIVADNGIDLDSNGANPTAVIIGHSLVENRDTNDAIQQSPVGSNLLGADPQLGPLADNGGPTLTQAPALTSPVIDAGTANGIATDQRGLARSSDQPGTANAADGTDMGAVELQAPDTSVLDPNVSAKGKQKVKSKTVQVVVDAGAGEAVNAAATGSVQTGKSKGGKGKRAKAKSVTLSASPIDVPAGSTGKLTLTPTTKSAGRKLARKLSKGGKAKASITVTLTDAAGNSVQRSVTVKLKGAKKRKKGK